MLFFSAQDISVLLMVFINGFPLMQLGENNMGSRLKKQKQTHSPPSTLVLWYWSFDAPGPQCPNSEGRNISLPVSTLVALGGHLTTMSE